MTQDLADILKTITARVDAQAALPAPDVAAEPDVEARAADVVRAMAIDKQIPKAFRWATVASHDLRRVLGDKLVPELVARILAGPRAVIIGPAGVGKTSLACAALRAHLEAGGRGVFASSFRLATARGQSKLGSEAADVTRALETPRLFLDELGGELASPTSAVAEILYERHLEGRFTLVTTPFEIVEIAKRYGDGIARKVFEGATVIRLGGAVVGSPTSFRPPRAP